MAKNDFSEFVNWLKLSLTTCMSCSRVECTLDCRRRQDEGGWGAFFVMDVGNTEWHDSI